MKATGIVRRIDDLGRVVIPKEIRRTLRIHAGDPLEIFVEGNSVIYKKYSVGGILTEQANYLIKAFCDGSQSVNICIVDLDSVIAAGYGKSKYIDRKISNECEELTRSRQEMLNINNVKLFDDRNDLVNAIFPIMGDREQYASLLVLGSQNLQDVDLAQLRLIVKILSVQLED